MIISTLFKPWFSLIISFGMLFALAACGDSTTSTGSEPTSTPAGTPAITGTPPVASTEILGTSATITVTPPGPTSQGAPTGEGLPTGVAGPTDTPTTAPAVGPATLEMRVTDAPPEGVIKILVTVENIQVNVAGGDTEGGWQTVIEDPKSFDLVALTGVEEVLSDTELPPWPL